MGNLLDVEANGGNSGDDFAQLELVQDSSLTSGIEADHKNTDLLLAEEASEDLGEGETHGYADGRTTGRRRGGSSLTRAGWVERSGADRAGGEDGRRS